MIDHVESDVERPLRLRLKTKHASLFLCSALLAKGLHNSTVGMLTWKLRHVGDDGCGFLFLDVSDKPMKAELITDPTHWQHVPTKPLPLVELPRDMHKAHSGCFGLWFQQVGPPESLLRHCFSEGCTIPTKAQLVQLCQAMEFETSGDEGRPPQACSGSVVPRDE